MTQDQNAFSGLCGTKKTILSRRAVVCFSGLAFLGAPAGLIFGRENPGQTNRPGPPREMGERIEQQREFSERMRNAGSMEERMKIMAERGAADRKRAVDDLKGQLELGDEEWKVVKPRLEAVYDMVHPQPQFGPGNARTMTPMDQRRSELRELLQNKDATPERIKAGLGALRSAKLKADQDTAKAKQDLRQLLTLRQEAVLVLAGLLE